MSLLGAQQVTVATVEHTHLPSCFPNHIPCLSLGIGQNNDLDDRDYEDEELYQVDGPTDICTPDNSGLSEDSDSEVVITSKDKRNVNTVPNMERKQMTKDRQQALAEAQCAKETEKAKRAQEIAQKQNTKKVSKRVPNNNGNNSDVSNTSPQPHRLTGRGKASQLDQIKSSRGARK